MFMASGSLFQIAVNAHAASVQAPGDGSHPTRPIMAIIAGAASLEAFINEMIYHAVALSEAPRLVRSFAKLGGEAIRHRRPVALKFSLAYEVFTGRAIDNQTAPFKDLRLLFQLRNALLHLRPVTLALMCPRTHVMKTKQPKIFRRMVSASLVRQDALRRNWSGHWLGAMASPATEDWVCRTASAVAKDVASMAPGESICSSRNLTSLRELRENDLKWSLDVMADAFGFPQ